MHMFEKLKLSKLKKFKRQSIFLLMAFLMVLLVGGFAIYGIIFLGSSLNNALTTPPSSAPAIKFDTEGFQDLKLIR